MTFYSAAIIAFFIFGGSALHAATIPGPDFYRAMTQKIRTDGQFRIYMPDGRNQDIKYHFKFAAPIYKVPMISDFPWDPPHKEFLRTFWDRIFFEDESYLEIGADHVPLTCIFVRGQDNRFSGPYNPLQPEFILDIYLVANDYSCQGPIRPGWPQTGGRKENWDTYMYYEVRDPTIMLPQEPKVRYRWNEFNAVLIDNGGH
jgi:hypothetical protein